MREYGYEADREFNIFGALQILIQEYLRMEVIQRSKNRYVLEPLKQYLINEGIKADIRVEWKSGRKSGPYVLVVEDALYDDAKRALDEIEKLDAVEEDPHAAETGRSFTEFGARLDAIGRWVARVFLLLVVGYLVYLFLRYR